jgi:hypothetical protein
MLSASAKATALACFAGIVIGLQTGKESTAADPLAELKVAWRSQVGGPANCRLKLLLLSLAPEAELKLEDAIRIIDESVSSGKANEVAHAAKKMGIVLDPNDPFGEVMLATSGRRKRVESS